jgi:ATP-dependent DNA helicase DinG
LPAAEWIEKSSIKYDFVIFDEAQHLDRVTSRHIGLSVSSGQMRFNLQRLWNPRTEKGILSFLRKGAVVQKVADALEQVKTWNGSALLSEDLGVAMRAAMQKQAPDFRD